MQRDEHSLSSKLLQDFNSLFDFENVRALIKLKILLI